MPHHTIAQRAAGLLLAPTLAVVLAACGGGAATTAPMKATASGPPATSGAQIKVSIEHFTFAPATLTAPAGSATIVVGNKDVVEHDFTIEGTGLRVPSDPSAYVKPGESAMRVVELKAGTYTFFCSVPGHRQQGMHGTITVQ